MLELLYPAILKKRRGILNLLDYANSILPSDLGTLPLYICKRRIFNPNLESVSIDLIRSWSLQLNQKNPSYSDKSM